MFDCNHGISTPTILDLVNMRKLHADFGFEALQARPKHRRVDADGEDATDYPNGVHRLQ